MPRASHRVADEEPRFERSTIVCADRADREELIAAPGKEHRLTPRMSKQHGPVGNPRELDALREIGSFEYRLFIAHSVSSAAAASAKMYDAPGGCRRMALDH